VDGLIAVNRRAGGHAGERGAEELLEELRPFGLPVVAAGGVGDPAGFAAMLKLGYAGVQMGTRFIATPECRASDAYKRAIVAAREEDVVLTERLTGIPVAVLNTAYVRRVGTKAGAFERWMLGGRRRKRWMRSWYAVRSGFRLRRDALAPAGRPDYWQAGKSVAVIQRIEPAGDVVRACAAAVTMTAIP
jgi:nitronate monooxygenase